MAADLSTSPTVASKAHHTWPPRLYLAIDCGGTKAAAAISDEHGRIIGRGQGGPSNYTDIGLQPFLASVDESVKCALEDARAFYDCQEQCIEWTTPLTTTTTPPNADASSDDGKSTQLESTVADALASIKPRSVPHDAPAPHFEAAWLGIAGVDSPTDVTTLSPHLGALLSLPCPSHRLIVANDTSLLAAPIADSNRPEIKSGVVAIAGTGSIVMSFRRRQNGMLKVLGRVGGFGWLLGDEGSGYSVGRAAIRKVLDLADRERLEAEKGSVTKSDRTLTDADDDSDSDEEDEVGDVERNEDTYESDVARRMSKEFHAAEMDSDQRDRGVQTTAMDLHPALPAAPYGHLLRDRILQQWGLMSTDELLRAVYFEDMRDSAATTSKITSGASSSHGGDDGVIVSVTDASNLSRSDRTVGASAAPSDPAPSGRLLPAKDASASLLPPSGPMLSADHRTRAASPIPSLSPGASPNPPCTATMERLSSRVVQDADALASPSPSASLSFDRPTTSGSQRTASSRRIGGALSTSTDSTLTTDVGSSAGGLISSSNTSTTSSSGGAGGSSHPRRTLERKHRLASLAPLVFHLAFSHDDALSLEILQSQARFMAVQICEILRPTSRAKAHLVAANSVLCLGGSLVGVQRYRALLVDELERVGVLFARVEFVGEPAKRGALALSNMMQRGSGGGRH